MTIDDILEGLKHCKEDSIETCHRCPYCGVFNCNNKLKADAASLIMKMRERFSKLIGILEGE